MNNNNHTQAEPVHEVRQKVFSGQAEAAGGSTFGGCGFSRPFQGNLPSLVRAQRCGKKKTTLIFCHRGAFSIAVAGQGRTIRAGH